MKLSFSAKKHSGGKHEQEEVFSTALSSNVGVLLCVADSIGGYPPPIM